MARLAETEVLLPLQCLPAVQLIVADQSWSSTGRICQQMNKCGMWAAGLCRQASIHE